jgi:hypothetical protein
VLASHWSVAEELTGDEREIVGGMGVVIRVGVQVAETLVERLLLTRIICVSLEETGASTAISCARSHQTTANKN